MADTAWVLIEHPDIDGTATVPARALNHWRVRGWTEAPPAPPAPRAVPAAPAVSAAPPATAAPKPADNPEE